LRRQPGAANLVVLVGVAREPSGDLFQVDLVRECVQQVVSELRELGIDQRGSISWRGGDTAIGTGMRQAERDAPGEGADAIIWDEVIASTGEDSRLTWTFMAFMILACILAAIGVATNSPITIVGAMVVGPEFGPLAGIAVGLRLRRGDAVRRGMVALVVGFAGAIAVTAAVAAVWRASGLVHASDLATSTGTEFIYHPGWLSLITRWWPVPSGPCRLPPPSRRRWWVYSSRSPRSRRRATERHRHLSRTASRQSAKGPSGISPNNDHLKAWPMLIALVLGLCCVPPRRRGGPSQVPEGARALAQVLLERDPRILRFGAAPGRLESRPSALTCP
jgi:hypothetical protein